jgi:hypothetical protein
MFKSDSENRLIYRLMNENLTDVGQLNPFGELIGDTVPAPPGFEVHSAFALALSCSCIIGKSKFSL